MGGIEYLSHVYSIEYRVSLFAPEGCGLCGHSNAVKSVSAIG